MAKNKMHSKTKLHNRRNLVAVAVLVLISGIMARIVLFASAATGTISLSTGSGNVQPGANFNISVTANADEPTLYVTAHVTYDPSKVTYVGINYPSNSPFNSNGPESRIETGYVRVDRFSFVDTTIGEQYPRGNMPIATITFKAVGSGSTSINLDKSKSSLFSGNNASQFLTSVSGVSINLGGTSTGGGTGGSTNTGGSSGGTSTGGGTGGSTNTGGSSGGTSTGGGTGGSGGTSSGSGTFGSGNSGGSSLDGLPTSGGSIGGNSENGFSSSTSSGVSDDGSLSSKIANFAFTILPFVGLTALAGGITWFIVYKLHQSHGSFAGAAHAGSGSTGGVVVGGRSGHTIKIEKTQTGANNSAGNNAGNIQHPQIIAPEEKEKVDLL